MHREFRAAKRILRLNLFGLFVAAGFAVFAFAALEPKSTKDFVVARFPVVLVILATLMIVSFSRFRLLVEEDRIESQGLFGTRQICLDAVHRAKWLFSSNQLWLYEGKRSLVIGFGELEADEGLALIVWLRERLPAAVQEGWDLFCLRVALPLQKSAVGIEEPMAPGQAIVTRRSFDRLLITTMAVSLAVVEFIVIGLAGWDAVAWAPLFAGLILAPILLVLRFVVPKKGMRDYRLSAAVDWRAFPASFLLWGVAATALSWLVAGRVWGAWPHTIITLVVWAVVMIMCSYRIGKRQMAEMQLASQRADAEWRGLLVSAERAGSAPEQVET